jgi:hypothetical protein
MFGQESSTMGNTQIAESQETQSQPVRVEVTSEYLNPNPFMP